MLVYGQVEECYIPASFKISRQINLKNKEILLQRNVNPKARTRFSLYAVKFKRNYILLDLKLANSIIYQQLHRRYFSFLGIRSNVRREKNFYNYKCDLFLEDTKTVIEIKTFITEENSGYFPSIYSKRAIMQLNAILCLLKKGYRACYIVLSMNPYLNSLCLREDDTEYCYIFRKCLSEGMVFKCY